MEERAVEAGDVDSIELTPAERDTGLWRGVEAGSKSS